MKKMGKVSDFLFKKKWRKYKRLCFVKKKWDGYFGFGKYLAKKRHFLLFEGDNFPHKKLFPQAHNMRR